MKNIKYRMLIYGMIVALSVVSLAGCSTYAENDPTNSSDIQANESVTKDDILTGVADDGTYLLKAIHAGFTEEDETVFETIDGNKIVPGRYDPDNIYMLTMYTNQTEDKADDEVSVIWATCSPME